MATVSPKDMNNAQFNTFLNGINSREKRNSALAIPNLQATRKNKLRALERKILTLERRARETKKANEATEIPAPRILNTLTPEQRAERKALNEERRTRNEVRPLMNMNGTVVNTRRAGVKPPKPFLPGKARIMTLANLEREASKKIFVNLSYIPVSGIRPFTFGTQGETTTEKRSVPVYVTLDERKAYRFYVEYFRHKERVGVLLLPTPIPMILDSKIHTVPKSEATLFTDTDKNAKKIMVQHVFTKDKAALYSISYEANLFLNSSGVPFFYFLNQPEFTKDADDGIPIYDIPVLPDGFSNTL
jgi:hypothetical protein